MSPGQHSMTAVTTMDLKERALSEAPRLASKLEGVKELYTKEVLSSPDVCVAYILITLALRHGPDRAVAGTREKEKNKVGKGHVDVPEEEPYYSARLSHLEVQRVLGHDVISDRALSRLELNRDSTIHDFWLKARCCKVPDYASACLDAFYAGLRPLRLMFRIPDPTELLAMQAEGARCVSALASPKLLTQVFGHRDCLEMLLHDLAHMEKFVEAGRFWQQVGFFVFLQASVAPFHIQQRQALGRRWELSWNYVSSDMNAVANHMLMTLKSQLMVAMARRTWLDAGFPDDAKADDELSAVKSDVYPRASMSEWKPSLAGCGLLDQFEDRPLFPVKCAARTVCD